MLNVASVCTSCYMLLHVVRSCCTKLETGQTFKPTTPNISFVPWSAGCSITMLDPFAQLFQHEPAWQAFEREGKGSFRRKRNARAWAPLLGPRTRITHGFQSLLDCILPMIHCRSQHCWELSHPFAHHCQHWRNHSHHCWHNNVRS